MLSNAAGKQQKNMKFRVYAKDIRLIGGCGEVESINHFHSMLAIF
jgi:hypothetical protein